jgi:hypothetical protein
MIARSTMARNQHPPLVLRLYAEEGEQHQEHEDVVHGERFFDQIAGEKFRSLVVGDLASQFIVEIPPQQGVKNEG